LVDIFRYYAREAGFRVARRFFAQADATLTRLASMPGIGTQYEHDHPALAGVRYFPISRFRSYVVFYRPVADGIEIIRVLHGASDIDATLRSEIAEGKPDPS
jgi:toxin ParE1/3/4